MKGYMYILECADQTFYVGSTNDLIKREKQIQGWSRQKK
jgi:predicted GIY-YIG superfamily endonuclease